MGSLIEEQSTDPTTGDLLYDPLTGDPIMEIVGRNPAIAISGGEVRFEPGLYILDSGMRINSTSVVRVVDAFGFVQTEPGTAGVTFYKHEHDQPGNVRLLGPLFHRRPSGRQTVCPPGRPLRRAASLGRLECPRQATWARLRGYVELRISGGHLHPWLRRSLVGRQCRLSLGHDRRRRDYRERRRRATWGRT